MSYTSTVVVGGKKYASQREASLAKAEMVAKPRKQNPKNKEELIDKKDPLEYKLYKKYLYVKRNCMTLVGKVQVPVDPSFTSFNEFKKAVGLPPCLDCSLIRIDLSLGYVASNLRWVEKKQDIKND